MVNDMEKGIKKPPIRFHGFTDDWEQRRLGDISKTTIGEFVIRTKQNPNSPYPVYNGGVSYTGFYDEFNNEGNKILVSARGANAGFVNIVKCRYWAGNSCYSIDLAAKNIYDTDFVFQYMKRNQHKFLENQQAANIPSVSKADVEKFEIMFPRYAEQRQIAEYFTHLDHLITLHQRKCDKLSNVKKSMLEKMFPKDGADVPEVRFKGFSGAWQKKKFSELYESVTQKNDLTYGIDKNITVASMQYRPDIKVTDIDYLRTYNVFRLGDIAFEGHKSKEFRYGHDIGDGIVSHIFAVFRPKMDYDLLYWKYAINNERIMRPVLVRCTKASTMMNDLVTNDFLEESILVPEIEEQRKIGSALAEIDLLISLQQQELDKLQNLKQALLEKMFV